MRQGLYLLILIAMSLAGPSTTTAGERPPCEVIESHSEYTKEEAPPTIEFVVPRDADIEFVAYRLLLNGKVVASGPLPAAKQSWPSNFHEGVLELLVSRTYEVTEGWRDEVRTSRAYGSKKPARTLAPVEPGSWVLSYPLAAGDQTHYAYWLHAPETKHRHEKSIDETRVSLIGAGSGINLKEDQLGGIYELLRYRMSFERWLKGLPRIQHGDEEEPRQPSAKLRHQFNIR